jgi:hypothetical protein
MKFIFAKTQNITHNPKELQPKVCSFSMVLLENDFINNEDLEQLAKMMGHGKGSKHITMYEQISRLEIIIHPQCIKR